jgi:hypothetical protein
LCVGAFWHIYHFQGTSAMVYWGWQKMLTCTYVHYVKQHCAVEAVTWPIRCQTELLQFILTIWEELCT